jgi:hypothetical protein
MSATVTTDYGTAISCVSDVDLSGRLVTGRAVLSQALARRVQTPRFPAQGSLIDDKNYGYWVAGELGDDLTPGDIAVIASNIDAEFRKDERVVDSSTTATVGLDPVSGVQTLTTVSTITDGAGPFPLVLAISAVTTTILGDQG